ncbi:hypothetical protein NMG60_11021199 [Bertholletia excelsa]
MADSESFNGERIAGGSFSQLLFAEDDDVLGMDADGCYNYTSTFSNESPPKMLCFGDYRNGGDLGFSGTGRTAQKSGVTCSDSSSASTTTTSSLSKANKRRNGSGNETIQGFIAGLGAPTRSQRSSKKAKSTEKSPPAGTGKAKREKLGERITALQQLVSPYGKTDTASVLHEAMGYIRFLHDQVQVLCSPYLQPEEGEKGENREVAESEKDLRSKGLCLVPVECTAHMANNNGADFWSPATGNNFGAKH